jgi:hypothetical protein
LDNQIPTADDAKSQFEQRVRDLKAQKLQRARLRIERKDAERRRAVKLVLSTTAEKRARAERACEKIHGMSVLAFLKAEHDALADSPEGMAKKSELQRKGFTFIKESDKTEEENIRYNLETTKDSFPNGITMEEIIAVCDIWEVDRAKLILIGRVMKNLGYRRVRIRVPATDDEPAKLGWIYRKDLDLCPDTD